MKSFTLGFSSCPNDTYIFDALVHGKIPAPFGFQLTIADVEELNQSAFKRELEITKISIHAWFHLLDKYDLLPAGGAMGRGCGPLVVARQKQELKSGKIALPGQFTTANLLFRSAFAGDFEPVQMRFDQIIPAILNHEVDAGVIIHESRFTYQDQGLVAILDLGQWWEQTTGLPIPLGGILVDRNLPLAQKQLLGQLIRQSILYAKEHPEASQSYIHQHAQELSEAVTQSHIGLYVNDFSLDFGLEGQAAIKALYQHFQRSGLANHAEDLTQDHFI